MDDVFDVLPGHSLELCYLSPDDTGIAFVSRTGEDNGVAGRVSPVVKRNDESGDEELIEPAPAGSITVALGGSVLSPFLQEEPFYTGFHVAYLVAKDATMTVAEKLWYVEAIKSHRFRFNYGRQANKQLPTLRIPLAPSYVSKHSVPDLMALIA